MKKFSFVDKEGKEIKCYKWEVKGEAKGIIQISHGMTEYACRYDYFANKLTEHGFIVYAHDHRGHGETSKEDEERGYIADNEGFDMLVENVKELTDIINGVILSGTNGRPEYITKLGILISKVEMMIRGRKAKSKIMDKLSFGNFNRSFKPNRTNYDWLCSVDEEVDKYIESDYCGFICTTSYYYDLIRGLWKINKKENLELIPKDLPVLIFAGDKDPVGDFGKGIKRLYECYKELGIHDLKYKLYKNGRHEMLNESNKDEVILDILNWTNRIVKVNEKVTN